MTQQFRAANRAVFDARSYQPIRYDARDLIGLQRLLEASANLEDITHR